MRLVTHLLGLVFGFGLIVFCIFNAEPAAVTWSPFHPPREIPLYGVILGSALFGFFWGAIAVFLSHHRVRAENHKQKRQIRSLEKEMQSMKPPHIPGLHNHAPRLVSNS